MELHLSKRHWLDAFTPPVERQLEKLARTVKMLLEGVEPPPDGDPEPPGKPPPPLPAWVWPSVVAGAVILGLLAASLGGVFKVKTPVGRAEAKEDPKSTAASVSSQADATRDSSSDAVESSARPLVDKSPMPPTAEGGWILLFNGKNLDGWTSKNNAVLSIIPRPELFVDRGEFHCPPYKLGGGAHTIASYKDFILKLEYRVSAGITRVSGILFVPADPGPLQIEGAQTPRGSVGWNIHYRVNPGETGDLFCGFNGVRRIRRRQRDAEKPIGLWNEVEIRFSGPNLTFLLNGETVNQATTNGSRRYHIGITFFGGSDIHYRNIRLRLLPDADSGTSRAAER